LPKNEEVLAEMGEVLKHSQFQWTEGNHLDSLQRAARIALHPDHVWATGKRGKRTARSGPNRIWEAGQKSISGAAGSDRASPRSSGGVRAAVDRAMGT
jgi:hypothetical protein